MHILFNLLHTSPTSSPAAAGLILKDEMTKPKPSFLLQKWLQARHALIAQCSKTAKLTVENSAQTTSRFSPVSYCAPQYNQLNSSHLPRGLVIHSKLV